MSSFFGSGGSGFGQNNQSSGFGSGSGFGSTNTGGGFGSGSAFGGGGTSNTGGGLFGSNNTSSGFGSGSGGGFGSNTQNQSGSIFGGGSRPSAFGSTTTPAAGGGFGSTNTGTSSFGSTGFGSTAAAPSTSFGANTNTGGGLFGSKPSGFGSTGTGSTGFGATGGGGFGSGATTNTGFGAGGSAFQGAPPACEGTGSTPFSPFSEKDGTSTTTNYYQSISFMQPYNKFSFEELRLADYQQGRRYGNASGQPGAFGSSAFGASTTGGFGSQQNTTGGFGSTSTPFGAATTSAPSAFGSNTSTAGGFGSAGTNSMFGASKPAGTGLFGSTTSTTQTPMFGGTSATTAPTGGAFGSGTGTGGGFGSGGSLFGGTNAQQNKPAFGSTGTTGSTFGGFGSQGSTATTTAANPFGGTTATSGFGGQQNTTGSAFGGFGSQNQTQNKPLFGGGGSTFGSNNQQQQSGTGLFGGGGGLGSSTTGSTGLFGQSQPQQQQQGTGSLFGGGTQTQQPAAGTGGLFGSTQNQQQAKPGGLFGSSTGTATGGGLGGFGSTQTQQPGGTTGGLFGSTQNQQAQKPGGLFGSTGTTGGGMFGGQSTTNQGTGSLFGGLGQQQQPAGNSILGASQPAQQQQPQQPVPGSLHASLLEGNPYGSQSIFSGLPGPSAPSPGPLATPLSSSMKQKQRTPLPVYKINPNASTRLITPPKRQGYGFSYSNYGSPASTSSTPSGLSNSLLGSRPANGSFRGSIGGSLGRNFSKSYSTSNLRNSFNPESDSVLSPGALQIGTARGSTSGLKRLNIDPNVRNDLFRPSTQSPGRAVNGDDAVPPSNKLTKKVSFDAPDGSGGEIATVQSTSTEPTPEELGFLRSTRSSGSLNGIDGGRSRTEATPRDLAVVPENGESLPTPPRLLPVPAPFPGAYWSRPSISELKQMTHDQLKHVVDFTVGRRNLGEVTFEGPIDLTGADLDRLIGGTVLIEHRSITVYSDKATKPARGKEMNVPSILRIQNSWPRGWHKGPEPTLNPRTVAHHTDRLKAVANTEFIDYGAQTGIWTFRVPHWTTYGLGYDDEEEPEAHLDQSELSAGPDNGTPKAQYDHPVSFEQSATFSIDESFVGSTAGVDDDTFDFKKRKLVPGSFGSQATEMDEDQMHVSDGETESFLEEGSTGSTIEQDDITEQSGDSIVGSDEDQAMDMAGSFPNLHHTVEQDDTQTTGRDLDTTQPIKPFGTPPKRRLDLTGDWTEQLQRTISPRKQNRDALREIQANAFTDRPLLNDGSPAEKPMSSPKKGFTNSIDLMNSLFQQPQKQHTPSPLKASKSQPKGFEIVTQFEKQIKLKPSFGQWPYNKQPKTFAGDQDQMDQTDAAFHDSFKPRWGPLDSIVCAKNDFSRPLSGIQNRWQEIVSVFSEGRDIAILAHTYSATQSQEMLNLQKRQSITQHVDGSPLVRLDNVDLRQFPLSSTQPDAERLVWQLVNILFNDDIEDDISNGVPPQLRSRFAHRIKKDRLSRLWESTIRDRHTYDLDRIHSPEERAFHLLAAHRVEEAGKVLVESQNLHLATLVAQIGRDQTSRSDIAKQIQVWRDNNVLSEMSQPVRALYELIAGNCLDSEGKSGGALEDRATSFALSHEFELDWLQAFGLRLWYGITEDEPIEAAVSKFLADLATGQESAFPHADYDNRHAASVQPGSNTVGRESPLWVLLKAYSASTGHAKVPVIQLPAALLPESLSGDRLTNRLSFQLHQVLASLVGGRGAITIDAYQTDRLVWDYASELIAGDDLYSALFVMCHLSRSEDRKRAVQETLARFGAQLPDPTSHDGSGPDPAWQRLTVDLQLPEAWIWVAKALCARDSGDAAREVDCLVHGKHWNDAHATFCRVVGPTAVISRDYTTLEQLVSGFGDSPERKVRGWASGGGIYEDFLRLATAPRGKRDPTRLSRLVNALVSMGDRVRNGSGIDGLEERVAFKEMSRAVAGWITHEDVQSVESSAVLGLPLTGDARILQTVEMSRRYYGVIMAGGS
ncbi:hypothetical protein N7492_009441 [Penicillium capsulatum]|uniref:Peptidase S59 domain-containing protein n=1 Tax=Penicillium capsulatum TaxID=69766 RepID=A0A9W9HRR6_9EURO|nr:hypothetical protein N7492_009441 [Penicillium capsulatum]KAJ6106831.1 hypothetical protein N7512_010348 [Penicillium capsulatum]